MSTKVKGEAEIYPTYGHYGTTKWITGYAVQFEGSDECIECHSGTVEQNKQNAILAAAAREMYLALCKIHCPECDHELQHHANTDHSCECEMGDREGYEGEPATALPPCGCSIDDLTDDWPDYVRAIQAIQKAKGQL